MFGQKNWLIIVLNPSALEIFSHETLQSWTIPLPPSIISNLEVIDRDGLDVLIADWTKKLAYQATEIIWLLSVATVFEATFPEKDKERWDTMTVQFLDTVPFEEVLSHVYAPIEGRNVVATNQDLISALRHGFAVHGYQTKAIIPLRLVGITPPITATSAKALLANLSQLLHDNMVVPDEDTHTPLISGSPTPKPKSQLPLLLAVFGVLLAILAVVIYLN